MRPIDIKTLKYRDNLASKRRQRLHAWTGVMIFVLAALIVGIGYLLFYTPWLRVNDLKIEGLSEQHQADVQHVLDQNLDRKVLGIPVGKNILFVHAGALEASLESQFSFLDHISIDKKYFHTLHVVGIERQAEGVWCFQSDCQYFDHNGVTWGQAIQSSGFLLLNIDDMRIASGSLPATIDQPFLKGVQTVVSALNDQDIKIKKIIIPAGSFTEFDALVSDGYPAKFSLDSDLSSQVDVYRIFRNEKMAAGGFHPQYVDLRFDGRVYFK